MLTVKLGPYHPSLETALAEDVRALARERPFGRAALVVPSRHLLARVQEVLARDAKLAVVGLDLFTFHGLSLRLYQESLVSRGTGKGAPAVPLDDPDLLAHAIRCLLAKVPRPNAVLGHPAEFPGLARALCATLRDLREAQVDPARAIEAVGEGVFEGEDEEKLVALFRLAQSYDGILRDIGVLDPSALARLAVERAPGSAYLASLQRVLYYGFYDLTQQQLDFFAAVAKAFPTTCYIPGRAGHPAWAFAEAFVTRHLRGIAGKVEALPDGGPAPALGGSLPSLFVPDGGAPAPAEPPPKPRKRKGAAAAPPPLEIWSAAGARDEVWAVAKEIVGLLDAGVPADGIAVVARSLAPYLGEIDRTFRENGIPYWTPGGLPLLRSPVARAVELLFEVGGGFGRSAVVELLASPYLARGAWAAEGVEPRPDLWDLATRRCGIRGGLAEWHRLLKRRAGRPLRVIGDREAEETDAGVVTVPPEQIDLLIRGVDALAKALGRIPDRGTWTEMADAARAVVRDVLRLPGLPADASRGERDLAGAERAAGAAVDGLWAGLRERDRLGVPAGRDELVEAVREALGAATLEPSPVPHGGVAVLDAMAARGRSCRILFLVGLNEKLFPRVVREDPFLRDGARRAVAGVLGHKMAEKLAGYEEEKLLLALLLGSAGERVVCTYQRSDEEGKVQVPSLYLREIRRAVFGIPFPDSERPHTLERAIPRRLRDRLDGAPPDRLLRAERSLVLGMRGGDVAAFAEAAGGDARGVGRALAGVSILESYHGATEHDGKIPPAAKGARPARPLSPTALETYALCPFRFFAAKRLKLEPLDRPEAEGETNVAEVGTLCHGILETLYKDVAAAPGGAPREEGKAPLQRLREIASEAFETFERDAPVAYPLVWESLKARLLADLEAFVAWDLATLREDGFRPALVEGEGRGEIPVPGGDAPPVACHGRMDRVDVAEDGETVRYRVVDYKTGRPFEGSVKNAALRGTKLQLPVYLVIAREPLRAMFRGRPLAPESARYCYLAGAAAAGEPKMVSIGGDFWEADGEAMGETLRRLVGGVGAGFFLISPGTHCRSCDYATICRKGHYPTARRSREDPEWALVRPS